jgi:Holliday junction resolvase RusA-like endonuclease
MPIDWRKDGVYRVDCLFAFSDHRHRDLDNVGKCVCDSGNGLVWHDDNQIYDLRLLKIHGDANPRTEVTVTRVGDYVRRGGR